MRFPFTCTVCFISVSSFPHEEEEEELTSTFDGIKFNVIKRKPKPLAAMKRWKEMDRSNK